MIEAEFLKKKKKVVCGFVSMFSVPFPLLYGAVFMLKHFCIFVQVCVRV